MDSKKIVITQSNYIPWKGYFDAIQLADEFVLYDDVQYTKRDWRNRNQIKTQNGKIWLTIPVNVKGKYHQSIKETTISEKSWANKHWKTIMMNYKKAPYFETYAGKFEELYKEAEQLDLLSDVNYLMLTGICKMIGSDTKISWSSDYDLIEGKNERLLHICEQVGATDYYSGPAAKSYMDLVPFEEAGVKVHFFDYSDYPGYSQLYGEFDHEVSIIDLIFNEGPNATRYMKYFS